MDEDELLEDEELEKVLSPHPLSFMGLQSLCIFLLVWGILLGWLVNFSDFRGILNSNEWFPVMVWGLVLLVAGVIASLIAIRWRIFFFYLAVFAAGLGIMLALGWMDAAGVFIPFYTASISILGFLMVELFRRSHKYIISNKRLKFQGGIVTKEERTIRYDKISDINSKQGILGQIFGFGTIIPISQSGFGLGSDKTFAGGGVGGGKKLNLFGFAGGGKEVNIPRSRSYFELHGIYPYKEVKKLVEKLVQEREITPYQQEQVAFQKEQVDVQKQMRDLLKMQDEKKGNSEEVEE
ncbi:MAG: PH domain-containing protein [Candidatus Thermoplasmatota archaeon]